MKFHLSKHIDMAGTSRQRRLQASLGSLTKIFGPPEMPPRFETTPTGHSVPTHNKITHSWRFESESGEPAELYLYQTEDIDLDPDPGAEMRWSIAAKTRDTADAFMRMVTEWSMRHEQNHKPSCT